MHRSRNCMPYAFLVGQKSLTLRRGFSRDDEFFLSVHFMHKFIFALDSVLGWQSAGGNCGDCCFSTTPRGASVQQMVYCITQRAMHAQSIDDDLKNVEFLCKTINNLVGENDGPIELSIEIVDASLAALGYNVPNDDKNRELRRNILLIEGLKVLHKIASRLLIINMDRVRTTVGPQEW